MRVTTVKNVLSGQIKSVSGQIKSVSESLIATFLAEGIPYCFSPQTAVMFASDFCTSEERCY